MSRFFIFLLALFIFDDEQTGVSGSFTDEIRLQPELSDNTVPGSEMNTIVFPDHGNTFLPAR